MAEIGTPAGPPSDATAPTVVPSPAAGTTADNRRLSVGRDLLGLALLTVIAALVISVAFYRNAADVATIVAPITTLVGTLIGAMFGVQAATQANAQQSAQQQETAKLAVGAALVEPGSPQAADLVTRLLGNSSTNVNPTAGDM